MRFWERSDFTSSGSSSQVLALDVLGRRHRGGREVVRLDEGDADLLPPNELRRPYAALAADELVAPGRVAADCRRLNETVVPERLGKFLELDLGEFAPRLERAALDLGDRQLQRLAGGRRRRGGNPTEKAVDPGGAEVDLAAEAVLTAARDGSGGLGGPRCLLQIGIPLRHQKYPLTIGSTLSLLSIMMFTKPIWKPQGHSRA